MIHSISAGIRQVINKKILMWFDLICANKITLSEAVCYGCYLSKRATMGRNGTRIRPILGVVTNIHNPPYILKFPTKSSSSMISSLVNRSFWNFAQSTTIKQSCSQQIPEEFEMGKKLWQTRFCMDTYSALWLLMPWCWSMMPSVPTVLAKYSLR